MVINFAKETNEVLGIFSVYCIHNNKKVVMIVRIVIVILLFKVIAKPPRKNIWSPPRRVLG